MSDETTEVSGAVVHVAGDPTVGIWSATWQISGDLVFDDSDDREFTRDKLKEAFSDITGEPATVMFDDEAEAEFANDPDDMSSRDWDMAAEDCN